jgi:hypothetical protein
MKLAEWEQNSKHAVLRQGELDPCCTAWDPRDPTLAQLWGLDDYFVSAVVAGTVWLCPRTIPPSSDEEAAD